MRVSLEHGSILLEWRKKKKNKKKSITSGTRGSESQSVSGKKNNNLRKKKQVTEIKQSLKEKELVMSSILHSHKN